MESNLLPLNLYLQQFGHLFIFASMFIENIGVPIPTEFGYLAAIALLDKQSSNITFILFILTLGHLAGSCLAYSIGRKSDHWLHTWLKKHRKFEEVHLKLISWYSKYGAITTFACRFIGYVRPWSSFAAGFALFPFWPFFWLTLVGSFIFNILALVFSYFLSQLWTTHSDYQGLIVIGIGLSFFGLVFFELARKKWFVKK